MGWGNRLGIEGDEGAQLSETLVGVYKFGWLRRREGVGFINSCDNDKVSCTGCQILDLTFLFDCPGANHRSGKTNYGERQPHFQVLCTVNPLNLCDRYILLAQTPEKADSISFDKITGIPQSIDVVYYYRHRA